MASRLLPFDAERIPLPVLATNGKRWQWIEVESKSKIYGLLAAWVPAHLVEDDHLCASATASYKADVVPGKKKKHGWWRGDEEDDDDVACAPCMAAHGAAGNGAAGLPPGAPTTFNRVALRAGFGTFAFADTAGRTLVGVHQRLGEPVGTQCGPDVMASWVLFTNGAIDALATFLSELVEESERARDGVFPIFSWHIKYQYWQKETSCRARPLSSVVLPAATKDRLVSDVDRFLTAETARFYAQHGIPYRRSYLFYGLPGTGKTSLVQALAGHFKRSVCFLQPTHPEMTDDSLRAAIIQVPEDSIVVFEDIDSLFAKDRSTKVSKSSLTFSGLLNALDGVGSPNGQVFVLTTNLREQLDPALIRNGRVDIQVEFGYATEEQICAMWSSFYPGSAQLAGSFHAALLKALGPDTKLVTSALQHFFVQQMRSSAEEALTNVASIAEDIKAKEVEKAEQDKEKDKEKKEEAEKEAEKGKAGGGAKEKKAKGKGKGAVHVHIHMSGGSDSDD